MHSSKAFLDRASACKNAIRTPSACLCHPQERNCGPSEPPPRGRCWCRGRMSSGRRARRGRRDRRPGPWVALPGAVGQRQQRLEQQQSRRFPRRFGLERRQHQQRQRAATRIPTTTAVRRAESDRVANRARPMNGPAPTTAPTSAAVQEAESDVRRRADARSAGPRPRTALDCSPRPNRPHRHRRHR